MAHPLDALMCPASIAIVGASDKPDTNGHAMFTMCRIDGYEGRVYPINPRLDVIDDLRCYPDLHALPEVPDHVVIGVASHLVEAVLDQAIELQVRSATIFASCFLDEDTSPKLTERISQKAHAAGMSLCGANCMGFYVPPIGLRVASMPSPPGLRRGGIAWIAQSGSALGALAHNDRRLGFSMCVSTGMELATTAADYMDWALQRPDTRVIGIFLEAVRDHAHFIKMLDRAARQNVPVVVLKVGRTEASAKMAVSHTGALAGNDAVFDAVFRKYGVTRVSDLDEMAATLSLFDTFRVLGAGGFGSIHDSGGERELVVDLAEDIDLEFEPLESKTCDAMQGYLELGLKPENPLDAYGTSRDIENRYAALVEALMADPNIALGYFMANPRDEYPYAEKYTAAVRRAALTTQKPLALVSNYGLTQDQGLAQSLLDVGVPLIQGTKNALLAAKYALAYRDFQKRSLITSPRLSNLDPVWREKLMTGGNVSEEEGLNLLDQYGINVPAMAAVSSEQELETALQTLKFPVVLKTAEDIAHKSDVGGVFLDIADAQSAATAYRTLAERIGPRALVMEMSPKGRELALGIISDDGFGPVVMISAGGIYIELLKDTVAALAPFDEPEALRLLESLKISKVLRGVRGQKPVDLKYLADQISRFSYLAADLGGLVDEMDVNPLICHPEGIMAVDCLIVPSAKRQRS